MDLHIDREAFLKTLSRIQTVVERRNTMPILGHTLLKAEDGFLSLSATDLEVSLKTRCPAEIESPGALAVSARKLFEIVRELPEGEARLFEDGNQRLVVTSGEARFNLGGVPADEFPAIPEPNEEHRIPMDPATLLGMFNQTHFAISPEESRFNLNGLALQVEPAEGEGAGRMRMVATDTHRLSLVEQILDYAPPERLQVIIPRKAVTEARKLLEDVGESDSEGEGEQNGDKEEEELSLDLVIEEKFIQFIRPGITLISKLVDGRYPNYKRVIPQDNQYRLDVDKNQLQGVVRRMSVLSNEKSRGVRIKIGKNQLKFNTNNPEQDVADEKMVAEFDGPNISLGFNARYLLDIIHVVEGETMRFMIQEEEKSVLVLDPDRDSALFVLMPMRV
ncbi:MAG: DNA polymerase III subunit beta [Magnetococcales bacterium]|nr:DNA polymerase III subunit beta [Magnetococcales bacterium]